MEEPPTCIVEHPGFQAVCLITGCYKLHGNTSSSMVPRHMKNQIKKSRHIAYRQLVSPKGKYCKRSVIRVVSRQFYSVCG
ncbi:unnamed protein product [Porites evermanni]|uniref:Uncharacterized protein n=1 Tax=Porites evermanni TaxID=104178 RepID=A0ABN8N7F2_9CNID|nr:unnamed protein product [Porites evermanni]